MVTDREAELLDIDFFMIRKFRIDGVRSREPMIPVSIEPLIVSSSRSFSNFSGCLDGHRVEEERGRERFSGLV